MLTILPEVSRADRAVEEPILLRVRRSTTQQTADIVSVRQQDGQFVAV